MSHITSGTLSLTAAMLAAACGGSPSTNSAPSPSGDDGPRIVQPGAPGEATRTYSAEELAAVEGVSYTEADVRFLHGMIPHHRQALEMTALVRRHATSDAVRQLALRMEISQRDEIALMEAWLRDHGEPLAMSDMGDMAGMEGMEGHEMHTMPGMLTAEQMRTLANARGERFDRLFLEYMIQHHQGAVDMVDVLFASSGAAQESTIYKFAEDVVADQTMEIARMQGLLETLR